MEVITGKRRQILGAHAAFDAISKLEIKDQKVMYAVARNLDQLESAKRVIENIDRMELMKHAVVGEDGKPGRDEKGNISFRAQHSFGTYADAQRDIMDEEQEVMLHLFSMKKLLESVTALKAEHLTPLFWMLTDDFDPDTAKALGGDPDEGKSVAEAVAAVPTNGKAKKERAAA